MKKTVLILFIAFIGITTMNSAKAQTYDPYAVQVINNLIANNGLFATPDAPETWHFATWDNEIPKKLIKMEFFFGPPYGPLYGDVSLLGLETLKELVLGEPQIGRLDLTNCTQLKTLEIHTGIMAEISNAALYHLKTDSIIDLNQIRDWYDEMYNLSAKYSLAETYYQLGKYDEGFKTLSLIPEMYKLSEYEVVEHMNYVSLFTFKNKIRESGRTIAELNEDEINQLLYFTGASNGLSSLMAKGILCFFYEICFEDETYGEQYAVSGERDEISGNEGEKSYALTLLRSCGLEIYPNPGKDYITVVCPAMQHIIIYDITGRIVKKINSNGVSQTSIAVSELKNGLYFLHVHTTNNNYLKRFTITR
jgi:hypothetical protein